MRPRLSRRRGGKVGVSFSPAAGDKALKAIRQTVRSWSLHQRSDKTLDDVDQTEIPFRVGDAFFEPGAAAKILIAGAVEVIDRGAGKAKPRRKGEKYLDTRSGRLRLAVIADNSAKSIEAFVRANVKPGATLLTDGHASYPVLSQANIATIRAWSAGWRRISSCRGAIGPSR